MKSLQTRTAKYRGRLAHSVLFINASIMQIQNMTQIQTKNPAVFFYSKETPTQVFSCEYCEIFSPHKKKLYYLLQ